jgi:hypothetical protein
MINSRKAELGEENKCNENCFSAFLINFWSCPRYTSLDRAMSREIYSKSVMACIASDNFMLRPVVPCSAIGVV